jgi:hypothetical protein
MNSTMSNVTVFEAVYEWNTSKILEIFASFINIVFVSPLMFYIIWYERFGANHPRTLINQLVASGFLYGITYIVFAQTLDIAVTAFGPFSLTFCHFRRFIRGILILQTIFVTAAITVVKYIYIFVLKVPPNGKEEFWGICINVVTLVCSIVSQFVSQFLPGRDLISIYICSGSFDRSLIGTPVKINLFSHSVFIISAIWCIFAAVKIYR